MIRMLSMIVMTSLVLHSSADAQSRGGTDGTSGNKEAKETSRGTGRLPYRDLPSLPDTIPPSPGPRIGSGGVAGGIPAAAGTALGGIGRRGIQGGAGRGGRGFPGTRGRGNLRGSNTVLSWEQWWTFNGAEFARDHRRGIESSGAMGIAVGRSDAVLVDHWDRSIVAGQISSWLGEALKTDVDLVPVGLLTWARVLNEGSFEEFQDVVADALKSGDFDVVASAILAMGISQHPEFEPVLRAILRDSQDGRASMHRSDLIESAHRGYAAIALSLFKRVANGPWLLRTFHDAGQVDRDLQGMIVMGMGVMPSRSSNMSWVRQILTDPETDPFILGLLPYALRNPKDSDARRLTVETLLRETDNEFADAPLLRSCFSVLGMVSRFDDTDAFEAILDAARHHPIVDARMAALMALGSMSVESSLSLEDQHLSLFRVLATSALHGASSEEGAWASLALGIYARGQRDNHPQYAVNAIRVLRDVFVEHKNPDRRGASALALGIAGAEATEEILRKSLETSRDPKVLAYVASALGLLGDLTSRALLQSHALDRSLPCKYRSLIAQGLGYLGSSDANAAMYEALREAESRQDAGVMAEGLRYGGPGPHVPGLRALAFDDTQPIFRRVMATAVLGELADRNDEPWHSSIRRGLLIDEITPSMNVLLLSL